MKKTNKNILIALVGLVIIVVPVVVLLLVKPGMHREINEQHDISTDVRSITFAVPDICRIDDNNLQLLNDELIKDGLHYRLEIKYLGFEEYTDSLEDEIENGNIDVAFVGIGNESGVNNIYNIIRSGSFYNLDDVLSEDTGKVLYDLFPKSLWESVKCDKHYYSIPSSLVSDRGLYVAFNRDYIEDKEIEAWDGKIEGLYKILRDVECDYADAYPFQYLISDYSFENMIGCEIRYGLLYDYDTLTVENPLETEKFLSFLQTLDDMKREGYMDPSISYMDNPGLNSAGVHRDIESGKYVIALASGAEDDLFLRDNVCVKRISGALSSRINGSIGIANNTDDINAVVDFLGHFYGSGKYGNILIYGAENESYKVVDGFACNIDESNTDDHYLSKLGFNLFINLYPVKGEDFINNRREEYFSFYNSIEKSPFIGFEPDTEQQNNISNGLDEFMIQLKRRTVDETLSAAGAGLASDGMDKYLDSVRNQWEEFK